MFLAAEDDGAAGLEVEPRVELADMRCGRVGSGEIVEEEAGLEEGVFKDFGGGVEGGEVRADGGFSVGEGGGGFGAGQRVSHGTWVRLLIGREVGRWERLTRPTRRARSASRRRRWRRR